MLRLLVLSLLCVPLRAEPALTILLSQSQSKSAVPVQAMKGEVARLLSPAHVSVGWISPREHQQGEHFARLVSITLRGNCGGEPDLSAPTSVPALKRLAHTETTDGQILPFATVDCDALRRFLSPTLSGMPLPARSNLIGVAVGRLVAHELYHILLQTRHHRTTGISRACFSLKDLLARDFAFDEWTIARLRPATPTQPPVSEPSITEEVSGAEEVSARD